MLKIYRATFFVIYGAKNIGKEHPNDKIINNPVIIIHTSLPKFLICKRYEIKNKAITMYGRLLLPTKSILPIDKTMINPATAFKMCIFIIFSKFTLF